MQQGKVSIIVPTLNAAGRLGRSLEALIEPAIDGLVKEVIVVDGGSVDESVKIANGFGAKILTAPPGRGGQMKIGAARAMAPSYHRKKNMSNSSASPDCA